MVGGCLWRQESPCSRLRISDLAAHSLEVAVDSSVILREAFDLLGHSVTFVFEGRDHLWGDVGYVNHL